MQTKNTHTHDVIVSHKLKITTSGIIFKCFAIALQQSYNGFFLLSCFSLRLMCFQHNFWVISAMRQLGSNQTFHEERQKKRFEGKRFGAERSEGERLFVEREKQIISIFLCLSNLETRLISLRYETGRNQCQIQIARVYTISSKHFCRNSECDATPLNPKLVAKEDALL